MNKKFKSLLSWFLVLAMITGAAAVGIGAASAADSTEYNEGAYYYTVTDGEAKITNVLGIVGDVTLPSTLGGYPVTGIGELSVRSETQLVNVVIPSCIKTIENSAFIGCTMLKTVTFEDNSKLKSLDKSAFNNCFALETVNFGKNSVLESIGESAFINCRSLYSIHIPDSVKTIGSNAFENCLSLQDVVIPSNVSNIGISAFANCDSLESFEVDARNSYFASDDRGILCNKEKNKIVCYPAGSKRPVYAVPSNITEIERSAFSGARYLEDLTWLNCDMKIGLSAFSSCDNLYRVTIPEGVTYLSDWMFNACFSLTEINFPDTLEVIGSGVFHWCTGLEHVELPPNLKLIYNNAFNDCFHLKSVVLPDGLEQISATAFQKCYRLESIDIPASVNFIGGTEFYQNYSLKEITFPEGIKNINEYTMRYCFALEKVNLPQSTEKILAGAFEDCRNLKTLQIPENVNSVTGEAFVNCISFEGVSVDSANAYFNSDSNGILFSKDGKKLVYYPANESQAVYTVPDNVSVIGSYAFSNAQNTAAIVIHDGVTEIESNAFNGNNIRDIYFEGTQEEWDSFSVGAVSAELHCNYNGTDHVHDYAQKFTVEPDCAQNGKKSFVCDCGKSTEIDYHYAASRMICRGASYETRALSESDCESKGQISIYCTVCEKEFGNYEAAKKEHKLDITVSDSDDTIHYDCTDCDYSYSETILAGQKYIHYINDKTERIQLYNAGDKIVSYIPQKEGLSFFGWSDSNGDIISLDTMPDKNLVLKASFGKVDKAEGFDVTATYEEDCFTTDVRFVVEDITDKNVTGGNIGSGNLNYSEKMPDGTISAPVGFYNIKMYKGATDKPAEFNAGKSVTIKMKIPADYTDRKDYMIHHWYTDGGREILSTQGDNPRIVREGDYLVFNVYQFSEFVLYVSSGMEVVNAPSSAIYKGGLDLSGMQLKITNADGSVETVTDTSKMKIIGFDSSEIGEQTVTVEYEGNYAEFKVSVSYAWWQWIIRILLLGFLWY